MTLKQNFIKTAHYLWSAEDGLFDATDIEEMLLAWLLNQDATTRETKIFIEETMDSEKLSDFNELCNRNRLTLPMVKNYFEEVYEQPTEEEMNDDAKEERAKWEMQHV